MLYLASQFAGFLVVAFGLGLIMGRFSQDGGPRRLWHPKFGYMAAVLALAAAASWLQALNGVVALWIESALLFVAAYLAGCVVGAVVWTASQSPGSQDATSTIESTSTSSAAAAVKPIIPGGRAASESADVLPKVANEDSIPGQRPSGLAVARHDAPDDLKIIKGIGPQNEERLHALGIWHFEQIANWTPDNVEWVGSYLAFPGRIEREEWIEQAQVFALGVDDVGRKPDGETHKASDR